MTPLLTAFTAAPETNQVYNLDLFALCDAIPSQSVHMILCDLPYGTTACSWDSVIPFTPMWAAFKRVIKPRGAIVLTAAQPFTSALVMSNPKMFKYEWIWDKGRGVGFLNAKVRPMMRHESVLVFGESSPVYLPEMVLMTKPLKRKGAASVSQTNGAIELRNLSGEYTHNYPQSILPFASELNTGKEHPTQKPAALFRYLIRTYTQPNELVFDPCVGSGTTAVAAREEGRSFIVGDSSLEYVEIARARLAAPYTPSFMPQLDLTA